MSSLPHPLGRRGPGRLEAPSWHKAKRPLENSEPYDDALWSIWVVAREAICSDLIRFGPLPLRSELRRRIGSASSVVSEPEMRETSWGISSVLAKTCGSAYLGFVPGSKRQIDVVLEPVMQSVAMRQLDRVVRLIATKDVVVTFMGESGTGKEVLARRLHDLSDRHDGPFVPINCAAIPEALIESELFGHEKGAFTGASDRARGKIEAAIGGTLFLDEIGEMPLAAQAKLLRFLENRRFMRVGGSTKITVDIRLVTATLRPLEDEVKAGRFREDLFYRIEGITLRVPPLRERVADITPLIHQFLAHASAKHGTKPPRLTRATMAALRAYEWPGNVRELRNAIQLLCLMREGKQARVRDLPERMRSAAPPGKEPPARNSVARKTNGVIEVRLDHPLEETIDQILRAALALEGGNRSRAARRLSIGLRTMQRYAARSRTARGEAASAEDDVDAPH